MAGEWRGSMERDGSSAVYNEDVGVVAKMEHP